MAAEAADRTERAGGEPDYLKVLNPAQREAVLHQGSPLLILAGAGSGKTRVITTKIAHLVGERRVDPRSILAVTFTNKAAAEMRDRVAALVPEAGEVMVRTFHSFGSWLLRRNSHLLNLSSRFSIYDDDDAVSLLGSLMAESPAGGPGGPSAGVPGRSAGKREVVQFARWISRAKDYALGPEDNLEAISPDPDFPEIYRIYEDRLRLLGNADFGDLILRPVELLRENPEVRRRIRQRFTVILVDEYQDSNVAQYELLKLLAGPETYLCVVGDDDQSIYRFRGAEVRNIVTFPESFPGTQIIRLEQNYRSTGNILAIASEVVSRNSQRLGKTLWTENAGGKKATLAYLDSQDEEAEFCASLLADGNLEGTAILYRTNAQSVQFETLFARKRIPYRIVGSRRFYDREEVKDVLAYLLLLNNPGDEVAFRRIVNKPKRGLGDAAVEKILGFAGSAGGALTPEGRPDFWKACRAAQARLSGKAAAGLGEFLALKGEMDGILEKTDLPEVIDRLIARSGLLEVYAGKDEITARQKEQNLEQIINAAGNYPRGAQGLTQLLEDMELDRSLTETGGDDSRGVTLITMHNTKGLEFDRVIITGLEDGLFPGSRDEGEDELEEERRIFYVSLTRARKELYLTACRRRLIWGRWNSFMPSLFLREIPREYLEVVGNRTAAGAGGYGAYGALGAFGGYPGPPVNGLGALPGAKAQRGEGQEGEAQRGEGAGQWPPGTGVYHDDYGPGVVVKEWHNGAELLILVRFNSGRTAQFMPRYASLERISDEWD